MIPEPPPTLQCKTSRESFPFPIPLLFFYAICVKTHAYAHTHTQVTSLVARSVLAAWRARIWVGHILEQHTPYLSLYILRLVSHGNTRNIRQVNQHQVKHMGGEYTHTNRFWIIHLLDTARLFRLVTIPDPLGRKSLPTMFSRTELFPVLCVPMTAIWGSWIGSLPTVWNTSCSLLITGIRPSMAGARSLQGTRNRLDQ